MRIITTTLKGFLLSVICTLIMSGSFCLSVAAYDEVIIVIDPGHGGIAAEDNTNGGCSYNGLYEDDINLITATALVNELRTYKNTAVYLTRSDDRELSLADRVDYAKSLDADVLISVHYNASDNHMIYGSEIFTSMYDKERAVGYSLAECIRDNWDTSSIPFRGIKTRKGDKGDYYGLIRLGKEAGIPTIILEHGYLDNDIDFVHLKDASAWQEMGVRDAKGIAEYYGLKKDLVRDAVTPTRETPIKNQPALPDETPPSSVNFVIDEYDEETGKVSYSLSAFEDNDNLMYFGVKKGTLDENSVFDDLILWDKNKGIQKGEFILPKNYTGKLTARVYNNYDLYTDSESIDFTLLRREKEIDASNEDEAAIDSRSEDAAEDKEDGTSLEIIDTIVLRPSEASEQIDIPAKLVDSAKNGASIGNKSKLGMVLAISFIILFAMIGLTVYIYKLLSSQGKKYNNKDYKNDDRWSDF